jgi:glycerol-1-phosphate dehydrogenase [NAD(P)+]
MDLRALLEDMQDCPCGKEHSCPIDSVVIGPGAINRLAALCFEYRSVLIVSDHNTFDVAGDTVLCALRNQSIAQLTLGDRGKLLIPNEDAISAIENALSDGIELVIGIGSGVINDLCKYVSFKANLPYYIVATAPSMDGYASVGAALILNGMKVTVNARPPKAIIADSEVLAKAPFDMIKAGYGDIIGKFSCLGDWKLSALINGEYFCEKVYNLTYKTAEEVKNLAEGIKKRDEKAIARLMEALVTVGIAMSLVGNSRPASGSEHHLSHFFEITGILDKKDYFPHGIDVAYSAVKTAKLREQMLSKTPKRREFDKSLWKKEIRRIYSTSAEEVIALQERLGWYEKDDSAEVLAKWDEALEIMKNMPSSEEFISMIEAVGLDYKEFEKLYGEEKIADALLYAKDLKDRYSILWLNYFYFED